MIYEDLNDLDNLSFLKQKQKKSKKGNKGNKGNKWNKFFNLQLKPHIREHIEYCYANPNVIQGWCVACFANNCFTYITTTGGVSTNENKARIYDLITAHKVMCSLRIKDHWKYTRLIPVRKDKLKRKRGKLPTRNGK